MSVIIKGLKMPNMCDECWALDESGDYPMCRITGETRGYNFCVREKRMDRCPLVELRSVANECYRGEVLYDAGIDAVLKRSEASLCDNCDERDENCCWCKRMERSEDDA